MRSLVCLWPGGGGVTKSGQLGKADGGQVVRGWGHIRHLVAVLSFVSKVVFVSWISCSI
jgi:hypothetical protein